jgi:hypothetical protein
MNDDEEFAGLTVIFLIIEFLIFSVLLYFLANNILYLILPVTIIISSVVVVELLDKFARENSKN